MIHPHTELLSAHAPVGYGVFATHRIPRGTITWVHDGLDQTFAPADVARLAPLHREALERFSYLEPNGAYVLCWDHARYSNHSCRPSCRTVGDFDIAVRDVEAGQELTIEYAVVNVRVAFTCACGDAKCRGMVQPGDVDRFADAWDEEVRDAARSISRVAQPLASLFGGNVTLRGAAVAADRGEAPGIPSCRDLVLRAG